jgi:hypothetical protein
MNIEKEREKFEAWYVTDNGLRLDDEERAELFKLNEKQEYVRTTVFCNFRTWQAAKADEMTEARAIELLGTNSAGINVHEGYAYFESGYEYKLEYLKAVVWWLENKATP